MKTVDPDSDAEFHRKLHLRLKRLFATAREFSKRRSRQLNQPPPSEIREKRPEKIERKPGRSEVPKNPWWERMP